MVAPNKKTKKRTRRISNGSFSDAKNTEASSLVQPTGDLTATRDEVNWGSVTAKDPRIDDKYTGTRTTPAQQGPDSSPARSKSWEAPAPSPEPPNPSVNNPYRGARGVNNDVPDMDDIFGRSQPNQPGMNNPAQPVIPATQVPDPNEQARIKPGDESFGDFSFDEGESAGAGQGAGAPGTGAAEGDGSPAETGGVKDGAAAGAVNYGKFDPKENMKGWNESGIGQVVNKTTEGAMKAAGAGAGGITPPGAGQGAGAPGTGAAEGDGSPAETGGQGAGAPGTDGAKDGAGTGQGGELTWEQLAKDLGLSIGGTIATRTPYLANGGIYAQIAGVGQDGAKDGDETEGAGAPAETGLDAWTNQANQTWQGFLDWEKKRQEQVRKEMNKRAWWNLMSKGLIGAANLAGTINGAPSLQLDMSVDDKNDPYARMKEDRTYMANLVNRRIEQINKEREAYRKAKNNLSNITLKRQAEERLYTDTMSRIKEREAKATLDQDKANLAAEARKEMQRHNMAMEEFKQEELSLRREMAQYDKTPKQSQASRNNRSSGSGDKTARRQVVDDNFVADVKSKVGSRYRDLSGYRRGDRLTEVQKAINALKAWIRSNPNDEDAKKLLEDYNKKKSNL